MGKKIVVLNGSPRVKGNTAGLVKAFTEGAEGAGHEVTTFVLDQMNIHGCKGCMHGKGKEEYPCSQRDDMDQIYKAFREAEVVIWASPLYYWTLSGQLRICIDRLFALVEGGGTSFYGKSCALLMAAEGNGFEKTVDYFDFLMEKMHWNNLGKVLASGCGKPGDVEKTAFYEEARKLGASL